MDYSTEIPKLRAEGKTYSEIMAITGAAKGTVSYYCGENQREKTVARTTTYRKEIRNYIIHEKERLPCADCKEFYPYFVMHFDHLPQFEKSFNLSAYQDYTNDIEVVKLERAKCEVVCSNCHSYRTHSRSNPQPDWDDTVYEDELD